MEYQHPAEPWRIKSVEALRTISRDERLQAIESAGYNTCLLRSEDVYIDLYTDSGTNAMSDRQWAAIMLGDEAYAGSRSFYRLAKIVRDYYGYEHVIPTHQGRGAENVLSQCLIRPGSHVPGNMYFATTRVHQELNGGTFHDVITDAAHDPQAEVPFKGNVDLEKLRRLIERVGAANIPYVSVAATVNTAGGQPISLSNLAEVRALTSRHGIPVILDAARAVENAWFIKQREPSWGQSSVAEILRATCDLTDGAVMSAKKDSLANIGGWLGVRDPQLADRARDLVVVYEGLHTYGGMAGRDMEAVAEGIIESVQDKNIAARIRQVEYLGRRLQSEEVPVVRPIGGHAVCLDAAAILSHIPRDQFPAQTLAAALYVDSGVRGIEQGAVSAGRDRETGLNRYPQLELVRLTIPRRVYTQSHMDVVAASVINLYQNRTQITSGLSFTYEPEVLRILQARFGPVSTASFLSVKDGVTHPGDDHRRPACGGSVQ